MYEAQQCCLGVLAVTTIQYLSMAVVVRNRSLSRLWLEASQHWALKYHLICGELNSILPEHTRKGHIWCFKVLTAFLRRFRCALPCFNGELPPPKIFSIA